MCVCVTGIQSNTCCSHKHKSQCSVYRDCPAAGAVDGGVIRMLSPWCVDRKDTEEGVTVRGGRLARMRSR